MAVTLMKRLFYVAPPLAGVLGYDLIGLLLGIVASVAVYMAPPRLSSRMTVRPPRPVDAVEPRLDVPEAAEPCRDAIRLFNRWKRECIDNCHTCHYFTLGNAVPCDLLAALRGNLPAGDPFTHIVEYLTGEVQLLHAVIRANNLLREREEARQNPAFKYITLLLTVPFQAAIYFTVLQILAYVASI